MAGRTGPPSGQPRRPHEHAVATTRGLSALSDRPDDERGAAVGVAGAEDTGQAGLVVGVDGNVAAGIAVDTELFDETLVDGMDEAHRQQDEVGVHGELAPRHVRELRTSVDVAHLDTNGVHLLDTPVRSTEVCGLDAVVALAALLVRRRRAHDERPQRPGVVLGARVRWSRQQLELVDRGAPLTMD